MLVSIDPGLKACGVAAWNNAKMLVAAAYVKNADSDNEWSGMVKAVDGLFIFAGFTSTDSMSLELAIELPQVYVRTRSKGDPNDLIQLAGLVGAFVQRFDERAGSTMYKPHEWKGHTPKDVTEHRARKRLSEIELQQITMPAASLRHNVWDAVGLGLHHLGR